MNMYYLSVMDYALLSAMVLWVLFTVTFFIAQKINRWAILDISWGLGFPTIAVLGWGIFNRFNLTLNFIMVFLVICWGVRLAIHLGIRSTKGEDPRYEPLKNMPVLNSYFIVFLSQALFMWLMCMPFYFYLPISEELLKEPTNLVFLTIGLIVCISGLFWEWTADFQLKKHIKSHQGGLIKKGLWVYSRHPNYFGEISFWWGIWLITRVFIPMPNNNIYGNTLSLALIALVSPLTITLIISKLTGPMLEKNMQKYPEWLEYKDKVPYIFPRNPVK